jgi:hypothetical protein
MIVDGFCQFIVVRLYMHLPVAFCQLLSVLVLIITNISTLPEEVQ